METRFRPIDSWPGVLRSNRERRGGQFSAPYSATMALLRTELAHLEAKRAVIQLALSPSDIRLDGLPRAHARPEHPGVIISFDSKHGPLRYLTDVFTSGGGTPGWQHNLRGIALGLEKLRAVDRYGITKRGEQYRGWAELPGGIAAPATHMTAEEAYRLLRELSGLAPVVGDFESIMRAYRLAARNAHPDVGGNAEVFTRLQAAKQLLERELIGG